MNTSSGKKKKKLKRKLLALVLLIGFLIPQNLVMPVAGATSNDYHPESFWYYPWGKSVVHHGVDVFAKQGTAVHSSTVGLVLYKGVLKYGGNVVVILGPKWRIHYYAHLQDNKAHWLQPVTNRTEIGTVGSTGNAVGKPPHLHYSISSIVPYPWRWDDAPLGWQKMFFLNPIEYLETD